MDVTASLQHRASDRVGNRHADTAAHHCDPAEAIDVRRHAERPDHVGQLIAHTQVRKLVCGLADAHEDAA
jgi:hypothetical protein